MKTIFSKSLMLLLIISAIAVNSYALEVETHRAINEHIVKNALNGFSLGTYLKNQLGFQNSTDEKFNSLKVWEWLRDGGFYEDKPVWTIPYLRSVNHFHNPITDKGFTGLFRGLILSGDSSIAWAQKPVGTQSPGGHYSWNDARDYFYKALTINSKATRDNYFAETFRGLGQLMHLVQDVSVPAHTRDDGHMFYDYEGYVDDIRSAKLVTFQNLLSSPVFYGSTVNNISSFSDTNQYNGTNPNIAIGNTIGLSEYTNANFFSEDTIFGSLITYPAATSVQITDYSIPDPRDSNRTVIRPYYKKVADGEIDYRLATVGLLKDYIMIYIPSYRGLERKSLDEGVYSDYAQRLIPRAVGYSAGLLNYFFRGEVEISKEIFEQITAQGITGLYLKVKNLTPNEEMKDGEVRVSYRYKPIGETEFTYGLSNPIASGNIPHEGEAYYNFTFPDPIPADATDEQYLWVFKGTLGQEVGAVVGKVTPDPCRITGEWLCKQDEGVSMILTQVGNNITGTWTDLLVYCPPNGYVSCTANGTGTYNSETFAIDLNFNTDVFCCCPQLIYEGALLSCDCMAGKLRSVCNPTTDATFTRKGSDALCFP